MKGVVGVLIVVICAGALAGMAVSDKFGAAESRAVQLESDRAAAQQKIAALESDLDLFRSRNEGLAAENERLNAGIDYKSIEVSQLNRSRYNTEVENESLNAQVESLHSAASRLEQARDSLESEAGGLKSANSRLLAERDSLRRGNDRLEGVNARLEGQVAVLKGQNSDLQREVRDLRTRSVVFVSRVVRDRGHDRDKDHDNGPDHDRDGNRP